MEFLTPELIIRYGGIALIALIIFAETGIFFCFLLPGDSLLFITGVMCHSPYLPWPVVAIWLLLIGCATLGSQVGFVTGRKVAQLLKTRGDSFFLKQQHLQLAQRFYDKQQWMAFVAGRFLPVIRTFVPILAGIVKVDKKQFLLYNIAGATLWITSLLFAGYTLGIIFPEIENYLGFITISIVAITSWLVWTKVQKERRTPR
jgi:membrane-associated protein